MEYSFHCPLCGSPRKSLRWNSVKDVWHCWRCGQSGRGVPQGLGRPTEPAEKTISNEVEEKLRIPNGYCILSNIPERKPALEVARNYLDSHHIDYTKVCHRIGISDWSLVVPVRRGNKLVFWVMRALEGKRFLCPTVSKNDALFGNLNYRGPVYVVESVFSALRMEHICNTVATLGSTVTDQQKSRLITLGKSRRLIILFDYDATDKAITLQSNIRRFGVGCSIRRMPWGDPCDLNDKELISLIS